MKPAGGVGQDLEPAADVGQDLEPGGEGRGGWGGLYKDRSPYFVPNLQPGHFDQCPDTPWLAAQYTRAREEHLF